METNEKIESIGKNCKFYAGCKNIKYTENSTQFDCRYCLMFEVAETKECKHSFSLATISYREYRDVYPKRKGEPETFGSKIAVKRCKKCKFFLISNEVNPMLQKLRRGSGYSRHYKFPKRS